MRVWVCGCGVLCCGVCGDVWGCVRVQHALQLPHLPPICFSSVSKLPLSALSASNFARSRCSPSGFSTGFRARDLQSGQVGQVGKSAS